MDQQNRFKIARTHHRSMKLNRGKCYTMWHSLHENFKTLDKYGHRITLTYKGKDTFQTPWGACISVLVCLGMTWVIIVMLSQIITMPFQRRTIVKELVNPITSSEDDLVRLIVEDPSQLFTFVNLDSFTEKEIQVSLKLSHQETDIVGYDNIFEKECSADKHICKISSELEPFFLYQKYDLPIYDVLDPTFEKPEEPKPGQSTEGEGKVEDSSSKKRRFLQPPDGGGSSGGAPSDSGSSASADNQVIADNIN